VAHSARNQPCSRCRRRPCACHEIDKPKPFEQSSPRKQRRPGYDRHRALRRKAVVEWKDIWGLYCPLCGHKDIFRDGSPVRLTADHISPVALGGAEDGPLSVHCYRCQAKQGGMIAAEVKRRKREP
jgi:hypothetical protein